MRLGLACFDLDASFNWAEWWMSALCSWRQKIRVLRGMIGVGESLVVMQQPLFSPALSSHANLSVCFDGDIFFLKDCSKRFFLLFSVDHLRGYFW